VLSTYIIENRRSHQGAQVNRRNFLKKLFMGAVAVVVVPLLPEAAPIELSPYGSIVAIDPWTNTVMSGEIGMWEGFRWVQTNGSTIYFSNLSDPDNFGTVISPSVFDEIN